VDGKAPQLSAAVGGLSAEATRALDMPRRLKAFLCLAAMDLVAIAQARLRRMPFNSPGVRPTPKATGCGAGRARPR
jgi:hypothetical protein